MKKIAAALLALALLLSSALAQEALRTGSLVENPDGLSLALGDVYLDYSENEDTLDTHGWLVIEAEILNRAVEELTIAEEISAWMAYQDKYIFDATLDFHRETIRPLVALDGRIILEIPMLVFDEAEPDEIEIFISVGGREYAYQLPDAKIEDLTMSLNGQPLDFGACVPAEGTLVFEWSTSGDAGSCRVRVEDWGMNEIFSSIAHENRAEVDLSQLPPGDGYTFVVQPLNAFDLWLDDAIAWCNFTILEATPSPTAAPTPEPTPTPTPVPTEEPKFVPAEQGEPQFRSVRVPLGESVSFKTQFLPDGGRRTLLSDGPFETADLTIRVSDHLGPDYYEEKYADSYHLQGNEACAVFSATLDDCTSAGGVVPQDMLKIEMFGENMLKQNQGFQLMDREISGNTEVRILPGETRALYKRYPWSETQGDMKYMVVTAVYENTQTEYWFELGG